MRILELLLGIGLLSALILGMLFLLGVFTNKDYQNWKQKISAPTKNFLEKVKDPKKRAEMNLKENWILWLTWSAFGIIFGILFYVVGLGAVALIKVLNYFGLREIDKSEEKTEDDQFTNFDQKKTSMWELFKNATTGFLKRAKNADERKTMDVDEYIMFMLLTTLPFSIPTIGLYEYFFAIGTLLAIIIAESVSGYKFTNLADLKEKMHGEGLAEKDAEIKSLKAELDEAQQKTGEIIVKHDTLKGEILTIAAMTKWKDEVRPALQELKTKLS